MKIILDEKIKEYITEHDIKRIVLNNRYPQVWGKQEALPVISFKEPDPNKGYNLFTLPEDVEIYIDETIPLEEDKLIIKYRDFQ